MRPLESLPAASLALFALLAPPVGAQSNQDPGIDVRLGVLGGFDALSHEGVYPGGLNAAAMSTTVCNQGDVVPWMMAMNPNHPFIAFLIAREDGERFEQISNRSFVKHGFSAQANSACSTCTPPGTNTFLGMGCSDTYGVFTNGDNFWLGPPDEIDPWLGTWDPVCSFFDRGFPAVAPPDDCDGVRSFTQAQANGLGIIGNRVRLRDADLDVSGATFWYQAQYVVATEREAVRGDNLGSRQFVPTWTGFEWDLAESGPLFLGSVLERWSGASVSSGANGGDDGRVHVGVKVTGPTNGFYHYELAVHNRDNSRGVDEIQIPLCAGARVVNPEFRDLDEAPGNDWVASVEQGGTVLAFRDPGAGNALRWNTIYNLRFDSDAAPGSGVFTLVQADAGTGAGSFSFSGTGPVALYNVFTGPGCSLDGTPPDLFATGDPARATLGNASFALVTTGNVPGQANVLATSDLQAPTGAIPLGACTLWMPGTFGEVYALGSTTSDASGVATYSLPVPNNVSLEGITAHFQALSINPSGGATFTLFDFSDGLEVRVGDSLPGCP